MTSRLRLRRGFTLLELLLVLALMGIMLSIGLPLLDRSLARAQFKSGVVELQTELQHTRLLAMKSGNVYVFRFLPHSGSYEVLTRDEFLKRMEPLPGQTPLAGSLASTPEIDSSDRLREDYNGSENQDTIASIETVEHVTAEKDQQHIAQEPQTLPVEDNSVKQTSGDVVFLVNHLSDAPELKPGGGAMFVDGQIEVDLGSRMVGSLSELPGSLKPEDVWSKPILFYPNGRTSQAIIQLESSGEYPLYSEIVLRGLTGSARVTAISVYPPGSPQFPGSLPTHQATPQSPLTPTETVEHASYVP